jgi:hypothetical protein
VIALRRRKFIVLFAGLLVADLLIIACSPSGSKPAAPAATGSKLWGDITPVVSVWDLMHDIIDPISDNIFESVKIVVDKHGTVETKPTTDADWDRIKIGATTMVEASQLLLVQRPFTPPGVENDSEGPDAPELSPAQIRAKIEKDPVLWQAKVQALRNVGLEVLDIVKKKNDQELWDAGENLDLACEGCHIEYWYPGDKKLYERLDKKLEELYGPRASRTPLGMREH